MKYETYKTGKESRWIMTAEVYQKIRETIGMRIPEQGGILGSSDGLHIDHFYHDYSADCSSATYSMNADALNKVIHEWNDHDIRFIGVIHSHPQGITKPSYGDIQTAKRIIETMDVGGELFTPIVQVSARPDGNIRIYPYTIVRSVEVKEQAMGLEPCKKESEAANRFARIAGILPPETMAKKRIICVGCGGSRPFLETMARLGVGSFVLIDGDTVEDTNIATQGTYISEIGKQKTHVIRDRILDINPDARVQCISRFLDDSISDAMFASLAELHAFEKKDILLCGCTDNFYAQDRCAQLSLKYGIPYLAAQIFEGGKGHEIIFSYPGLTTSCPRCMLEGRYEAVLTNAAKSTGSSANAAVCVTDYLNSIKSYVAMQILCYEDEDTAYYHALAAYADRNYFLTKCKETFRPAVLDSLHALSETETDLSFPYVTVAIGQTPEAECPLCHGVHDLRTLEGKIQDTRMIAPPKHKIA